MQSGAGLGMFNRHQQSLEDGHRTAERLFEALGVSSLDEARQVPAADRRVRVQWDAGGVHGVVGADERDPSGRMVRGEAEVVDVAEAAIQEFREFCGTVEYGHADDGHDRAYASARHADLRVGRGCV